MLSTEALPAIEQIEKAKNSKGEKKKKAALSGYKEHNRVKVLGMAAALRKSLRAE